MSKATGPPAKNLRLLSDYYKQTGALYETLMRTDITAQNLSTNTAGNLTLAALILPQGLTVTTIKWISGSTAQTLGTTPHYFVALYRPTLALLGQSTDVTNKTINAGATITDNLTAPVVTLEEGLHYIAVMVNSGGGAGVQPTMAGVNMVSNQVAATLPRLAAVDSSVSTTTAPANAVLATATGIFYSWVL